MRRNGRTATITSHRKTRWRLAQLTALATIVCLVQAPARAQNQLLDSSGGAQPQKTQPTIQQQKVGLAPHERPSCQLQLPTYHRRHSQMKAAETHALDKLFSDQGAAQDELLTSSAQNSNHNSTSITSQAASSGAPVISAPAVLSLQPPQSATFANNLIGGPVGRKFDSSERLRQLRQLMISNNYDAYLVTSNDEHGSEYLTEHDRRIRFISGFTGSYGYALIMLDRAVLFTDPRYTLQADKDLDCNWWLVVSEEPLVDVTSWLRSQAARGIKVATDARLMSLQNFDYLDEQLRRLDSEFVLISQDLIDVVWDSSVASGEAPARSPSVPEPIFVHPLQFAGNISWQEKVIRLANEMAKLKAKHYVVSKLDDIAWLLNLRGNDIPMTPLFKAYVFVSRSGEQPQLPQSSLLKSTTQSNEQATTTAQVLHSPQVLQVQPSQTIRVTLYVDLAKVDQQVREHLHTDNGTIFVTHSLPRQNSESQASEQQPPIATVRIQVELKDYQVFIMDLRDRLSPASGTRQLQGRLLLNAGANVAIHVLAKAYDNRLVLVESLINKMKAVKNDAEVQGMRLAHWRDSLAIAMLLGQLEQDIGQMGLTGKWSEISAAKELEFYRSLMDYNKGQSFETISAYGSNAAIVHYQPNENEQPHRLIGNHSTYLLDCGGQYLDGTTDITRTLHYGEPTEFQRETYTRVLMGSIDTMSLIFDQATRHPYRINDLLARRHLFELGLDYGHGTGHGIGLFSLVHEAPNLIENYGTSSNGKLIAPVAGKPQQAQVLSDPVTVQANMFTSVEPGYYKANDFGIRLENIVVSQRVNLPAVLLRPNDRQQESAKVATSGQRQFLRWEPISLVPFEPKLIKLELLSNKQKAWLNSYNLMVRVRMTQQINYYLNKTRSQQSKPIQVQGVASSSRLYQQLMSMSKHNNASANFANNHPERVDLVSQGQENYLRMDAAKLQEKLELAHRWIMAKTELIPLDVPQSLVAPLQPKIQSPGSPTAGESHQGSSNQAAAATTTESPVGQQDSNRLMLAYMSSLPFNDREAGEAIASGQLGARADADKQQQVATKCSGFQCDIWLLDSMERAGRKQRHRVVRDGNEGSLLPTWAEQDLDTERGLGASGGLLQRNPASSSSLLDLFKLGPTGQASATIGMWSLLVLGLIVAIQLAVATYLCRGGKSSRVHIAQAHAAQAESVQLSTNN